MWYRPINNKKYDELKSYTYDTITVSVAFTTARPWSRFWFFQTLLRSSVGHALKDSLRYGNDFPDTSSIHVSCRDRCFGGSRWRSFKPWSPVKNFMDMRKGVLLMYCKLKSAIILHSLGRIVSSSWSVPWIGSKYTTSHTNVSPFDIFDASEWTRSPKFFHRLRYKHIRSVNEKSKWSVMILSIKTTK